MKRTPLLVLALVLAVPAVTAEAFADPVPAAAPLPAGLQRVAPGTYTMPTATITGRAMKPTVSVIVRTPSAAGAAGAAHERLRDAVLARSEPGAFKLLP